MTATLNMFDLIFIFATLIFVIIAFFRGFIKEIFALINWIITILLTYLLSPFVARFIEHYSHNKTVAVVASSSMVFIVIFILVALSTRKLADSLKDKISSTLDQVFGVIYGFFKSMLIFGLVYSFTVNFYESLALDLKKEEESAKPHKDKMPEWLAQARFLPIIGFSGKVLNPLVQKAIKDAMEILPESDSKAKTLDEKIDEVAKDTDKTPPHEDQKKSDVKYDETGYSKKEIEKMNRLIEIVE